MALSGPHRCVGCGHHRRVRLLLHSPLGTASCPRSDGCWKQVPHCVFPGELTPMEKIGPPAADPTPSASNHSPNPFGHLCRSICFPSVQTNSSLYLNQGWKSACKESLLSLKHERNVVGCSWHLRGWWGCTVWLWDLDSLCCASLGLCFFSLVWLCWLCFSLLTVLLPLPCAVVFVSPLWCCARTVCPLFSDGTFARQRFWLMCVVHLGVSLWYPTSRVGDNAPILARLRCVNKAFC